MDTYVVHVCFKIQENNTKEKVIEEKVLIICLKLSVFTLTVQTLFINPNHNSLTL